MTDKSGWDLAEEGIKVSYENAAETWKAAALEAVFQAAQQLEFLTADDVWGLIPKDTTTANASALGGVMREAKKNGWIEDTGTTKRASRPTLHAKHRPIWKSKIWNKRAA